jgi:hypothetical protein
VGLREIAKADLTRIMQDSLSGFAWPITITNPDGSQLDLDALTQDIGRNIDPETGQVIAGRLVTVAIPMQPLEYEGIGMPTGVQDANAKPWVVEFDNMNGVHGVYKVKHSEPDHMAGCIVCHLENYVRAD